MSKEAMKLALEGAANYIDALGGDSRKYRQTLASEAKKPDFWEGYVPEPVKPATEESSATQAQQALDKKAENARELGLDYEPAQQCKWPTCQSEEYQQALAEQIKRELVGEQPAQRTWQGLTDEEIEQGCKESWVTEQAWQSAVWWAEAKLRGKNENRN